MAPSNHRPTISRTWRLVVLERAWAEAWRRLTSLPEAWAVGSLAWHHTGEAHELLLESLVVSAEAPDGAERLPADDWLVMGFADLTRDAFDAQAFTARLHPTLSQTLVVVLVDRQNRSRWEAWVTHRETLEPLPEIRVIGPRMLRLSRRQPPAADLGSDPRWSRTRGALGDAVVEKLQAAEITLIGAGRNGSAAAFQFAALGVRRLRVIDGDTLRLANMDAMIGLSNADVGGNKAQALARRLRAFRPNLALTAVDRSVVDPQARALLRERSDLLVTCVDHDAARLAAGLAARRTLTVHLDIGTSVQGSDGRRAITGDARLLLPGQGCVVCVGGMPNVDNRLYDLQIPADNLHHQLQAPWHQRRAGSLITINAVTVAAGVQMWLDLLRGELRESHWQRLDWQPGAGLEAQAGAVDAAADCRFCLRTLA